MLESFENLQIIIPNFLLHFFSMEIKWPNFSLIFLKPAATLVTVHPSNDECTRLKLTEKSFGMVTKTVLSTMLSILYYIVYIVFIK